jgi:hypothetical protein
MSTFPLSKYLASSMTRTLSIDWTYNMMRVVELEQELWSKILDLAANGNTISLDEMWKARTRHVISNDLFAMRDRLSVFETPLTLTHRFEDESFSGNVKRNREMIVNVWLTTNCEMFVVDVIYTALDTAKNGKFFGKLNVEPKMATFGLCTHRGTGRGVSYEDVDNLYRHLDGVELTFNRLNKIVLPETSFVFEADHSVFDRAQKRISGSKSTPSVKLTSTNSFDLLANA